MKVIRHEFFVRINRTVHSVSKSLVFINIGAAVQLWEAKFDSSRMRSHSAVTSSHNKFQVRFLTTTCSVLTGRLRFDCSRQVAAIAPSSPDCTSCVWMV